MTDENDEKETALEKEFTLAANTLNSEIKSYLITASEQLRKAVELSEKLGVPFDSPISFLNNSYTPKSFQKKFKDLDQDFVESVTGVYQEYGFEYGGWEHSAVC
jgi:hypothetical protein